jgi:hypothetical protein
MRRFTCESRAYNLTSLPDIEKAGPVPMQTAQYVSKRPNRSLYHRLCIIRGIIRRTLGRYYQGYPWKKLVDCVNLPAGGLVRNDNWILGNRDRTCMMYLYMIPLVQFKDVPPGPFSCGKPKKGA